MQLLSTSTELEVSRDQLQRQVQQQEDLQRQLEAATADRDAALQQSRQLQHQAADLQQQLWSVLKYLPAVSRGLGIQCNIDSYIY